MCRNGYPEGGESLKNQSFLLGSALGFPGALQVTKKEPKGAEMPPRAPKIVVLESKTASKMHNFFIDFRQIFGNSESILGLEMQKTGYPYVHEKRNVVSERRGGGVGRSPLDIYICTYIYTYICILVYNHICMHWSYA